MKLKIGFKNSLPSFPHTTEAKITQSAYLQLESEDLRPLSEFDKVALKLINFICFAMDEIVAIKDVSATSKEIESPISPTQKSRVPIVIYYKSHSYTEKKPQKHWHEMLFRFSSIKENAEFVFNAWINSYETLLPAFYLYFSTRIDASKYLESKFLSLAQGLESYHRRTSNEKRMQEDDFEEIVSKIIEKFPEHQEFLEGRLQHGNEITFRKRLQRIFEPFKSHFGSSKERGSLINKIANTRNYLTHYDESLESEAAKGTELWNISVKMEVVFSLNFLRVIGFSDSEIASMVKSNRPLGQKLYQLRE